MGMVLSCQSKTNADAPERPNPRQLPSQFLNPSEIYPDTTYLSSVGSGDTMQNAQKSALSALAQQIKVDISSTETLSESLSETANASSLDFINITNLDATTSVSAQQQLLGVQFGESYVDNVGTVHVIAYINRLSVGNIYRQQIDERNREISELMKKSELAEGLSKYAYISTAISYSQQNDSQREQLDVIAPAMSSIARTGTPYTTESLASQLRTVAKGIKIAIRAEVEGNNAASVSQRIANTVANLLTELGFTAYQISENEPTPYMVDTQVALREISNTKYATIEWNVTIQMLENQDVIMSHSTTNRSSGKDITDAEQFALFDINNEFQTTLKNYIRSQLQ